MTATGEGRSPRIIRNSGTRRIFNRNDRNPQHDFRPFAEGGLNGDLTARAIDDSAYECEPEPRSPSSIFCAVERIERVLANFFRHAHAIVGDRDSHPPTAGRRLITGQINLQTHAPIGSDRITRVDEEVQHDLGQSMRGHADRREVHARGQRRSTTCFGRLRWSNAPT